MNQRVYIETTIVSYLTQRSGGDLAARVKKQSTVRWWNDRRDNFDLFVSELVMQEAGRGHPQAAERRLEALAGIPALGITKV